MRSRSALEEGVRRAVRRLRIAGVLAVAAAVLAVIPATLLVAWAVGAGWGDRGPGPLLLVVAGLAVSVAVAAILARRWVAAIDDEAVAAAAERARGLPEGSLRGVLELGRSFPAGVSRALFRRTEAELEGRLASVPAPQLAGDLRALAGRRRVRAAAIAGALAVLAGLSGFMAPGRARAAWSPLLRPVAHLTGPALPPLVVRPGNVEVARGSPLDVEVEGAGRDRVVLHWRAAGDVPRRRTLGLAGGRGRGTLGPVEAPLDYWVTAPDGAASEAFRAVPRDPLLLTTLVAELSYPSHVGRPPERLEGEIPPLSVPEGTRLRLTGGTTRPVARAELRREDGVRRELEVAGAGFTTDWSLDRTSSGLWSWTVTDSAGESGTGPGALDIRVTRDRPPEVQVTVPGADTVMPASLRQPVVADAADDYGLTAATLVVRRVGAAGRVGPSIDVALPVDAVSTRVLLRGVLDATGLELVAGDVVEYYVQVRDNAPAAQVGRSATYRLSIPGRAELRDLARQGTADALERTRALAERAGELETETRNLLRRLAGQGRSGSAGGGASAGARDARLDFDVGAEAREVAGRTEDVLARAEAVRERVAELDDRIAEAGLQDPELERRLRELRELLAETASPEAREEVRRLREAIASLDPDEARRALERLAEQQGPLREQVERTLALMERAAADQEMAALAREAEEIAGRQEALAEAMAEDVARAPGGEPSPDAPADSAADPRSGGGSIPPSAGEAEPTPADSARPPSPGLPAPPRLPRPELRVGQQEELQERASQLNQALRALQERLAQLGDQSSSSSAATARNQGEASRQWMQQAADEARSQQGGQASRSGQKAAAEMSRAASTLDAARQQMGEAGRQRAEQAVRQATQEALELAERQEELRQEMESRPRGGQGGVQPGDVRAEQAALQQGLEQLDRTLTESAQQQGRLDRAVRQALERARLNMQETLDGLGPDARGMPVEEAGRSVESLNQLAMELLESEQRTSGSSGSSSQQAIRQLAELAREQGALNGELAGLTTLQPGQEVLRQQLRRAAARQRGIGRRVGQVSRMTGGRDDVLGQVDQLSTEAEQIARDLDGGRLDPDVRARQERLFNRLLDAGRSLERDEYSNERVSRSGEPADAPAPPRLDPALLAPWLRFPSPSGDELERLPPGYRSLILEYFDRLNRSAAEDPGAAGGGDA